MPTAGSTPGSLDFSILQGATFNVTLTWRDDADALINLTGYTARMDVRATLEESVPEITLNTTNGRIVLGGAAGTIQLLVPATDTAALDAGNYVYDLELVTGSTVTRLIEGAVVVDREVTRLP